MTLTITQEFICKNISVDYGQHLVSLFEELGVECSFKDLIDPCSSKGKYVGVTDLWYEDEVVISRDFVLLAIHSEKASDQEGGGFKKYCEENDLRPATTSESLACLSDINIQLMKQDKPPIDLITMGTYVKDTHPVFIGRERAGAILAKEIYRCDRPSFWRPTVYTLATFHVWPTSSKFRSLDAGWIEL